MANVQTTFLSSAWKEAEVFGATKTWDLGAGTASLDEKKAGNS